MPFPVYSIENDFTDGIYEPQLHEEIKALGITTAEFFGIGVTGDNCSIMFNGSITPSDISSVDTAVASHDALPAYKSHKIKYLDEETNKFITDDSRYPMHKQMTLTKLQVDARALGLTNRVAYIQQGWDWAFSVMGYFYQKEAQVKAATDKAGVDAVVMDFSAFILSDPHVSIYTAMGITT